MDRKMITVALAGLATAAAIGAAVFRMQPSPRVSQERGMSPRRTEIQASSTSETQSMPPAHAEPSPNVTNAHSDVPVPAEAVEAISAFMTAENLFSLSEAEVLAEMRKQGLSPASMDEPGSGGATRHSHTGSKPEAGVFQFKVSYDDYGDSSFKLVRADYDLSVSSYENVIAKVESDLRARFGGKPLEPFGPQDNPHFRAWKLDTDHHIYVRRHTAENPRAATGNPIQVRIAVESSP